MAISIPPSAWLGCAVFLLCATPSIGAGAQVSGNTPLHRAVERDDAAEVARLI